MTGELQIELSGSDFSANHILTERSPLILGRQASDSEKIGRVHSRTDPSGETYLALPVHEFSEHKVSRRQMRIGLDANGRLRVENLSSEPVELLGKRLRAGDVADSLVLPVEFTIREKVIKIGRGANTLSERTRLHSQLSDQIGPMLARSAAGLTRSDSELLLGFLNRMVSVLQKPAPECALCEQACEAVARLIDVDGTAIVAAADGKRIAGDCRTELSERMLRNVAFDQHAVWEDDHDGFPACLIAVPIPATWADDTEVFAVLYAIRDREKRREDGPFTELDARLIELVALTLSASLARKRQELQIGRFEQFFTPELVSKLMEGDQLLRATEREISVMFCDIRGFSGICEDLKPHAIAEWINDVLSALSDCVQRHQGVLVDYIGDEVMAMWGAPEKQPDHADKACLAALDMLDQLEKIDEKWQDRLQSATEVGIGVSSGLATVGNTGSRQKFKYGPLGDTVNRASRVQGYTKHFRVPILITKETKDRLQVDLSTRRLGNAKAVNLKKDLVLYELIATPTPQSLVDVFERALDLLEAGRPSEAAEELAPKLDFRDLDHPSLLAFGQIIEGLLKEKPFVHWDSRNK